MLRSMYSGISGMRVNQTKLDVIGNNIANVGTTAFKSSRVRFSDMLSQTMSEAIGPGRNQGGVNGSQVGLGVQISGIDNIMKQGHMQPTGRNLDVGVDGEGYFMVARLDVPKSNEGGIVVDSEKHNIISANGMEINFTRDGSFTLDHEGNLLTSDGGRILGYAVREKEGTNISTRSIDYSKQNGLVSFVDADKELKAESNLVPLKIPDSVHVNASNVADGNSLMKFIGTGDTTGIDDPKIHSNNNNYVGEFDTKVEVKWDNGQWGIFLNGENVGQANTSSDTEINIGKDGKLVSDTSGKQEGVDYVKITVGKLDSDITAGNESRYSWSYTLKAEAERKVRSFSIEKDGMIKAILQDGTVSAIGQIAMSSFKNPGGLKKLGKNLFQRTANSGLPLVRSGIGVEDNQNNSSGYGDMLQGMIEMSNVDLAEQFTDMIVTSRAFQASSKMISTGDEVLQDIINLKR